MRNCERSRGQFSLPCKEVRLFNRRSSPYYRNREFYCEFHLRSLFSLRFSLGRTEFFSRYYVFEEEDCCYKHKRLFNVKCFCSNSDVGCNPAYEVFKTERYYDHNNWGNITRKWKADVYHGANRTNVFRR